MIRVFLADDHAILRAGLRALLSTAKDITITGEAADGRSVLRAMESETWAVDVLLLDLSLPKVCGAEVLRRARERHPELRVLVLSMYAEEQHARQMIDQGASGYLSKDRTEDELIAALRSVARGVLWVPESAFRKGLHAAGSDARDISPRERQILMLLVDGRSVTDIASELNVSVSTVSTHLGRMKSKLGLTTIGELIGYAHRSGLAG